MKKLLLSLLLFLSIKANCQKSLGISLMERRNSPATVEYSDIKDGDTIRYYSYSIKGSEEDEEEFFPGFLMFKIAVMDGLKPISNQNKQISITYYKGKDSVSSCTTTLKAVELFVCNESQINVSHALLSVEDSEKSQYRIVIMFDGRFDKNKKAYFKYDE